MFDFYGRFRFAHLYRMTFNTVDCYVHLLVFVYNVHSPLYIYTHSSMFVRCITIQYDSGFSLHIVVYIKIFGECVCRFIGTTKLLLVQFRLCSSSLFLSIQLSFSMQTFVLCRWVDSDTSLV